MGSSSQGQSRRGQSSSGRDLSPISPLKGRVLAGVGVVQLRLLPAPAQKGEKPGSVTSRQRKFRGIHNWSDGMAYLSPVPLMWQMSLWDLRT